MTIPVTDSSRLARLAAIAEIILVLIVALAAKSSHDCISGKSEGPSLE